ncbi:response regulator transcription factor [Aquihabitans sp. McL0605]|uniref:response regulator transcription factor n=1 Tax=Aquihabitans sp. McL0605 TaxID=3415671 RepID=UPI003CFB3D32
MRTGETTVVVVEDDANIAGLVDLYLRDAGFRVSLADRGEKALDLIRARQPNLVILDVGLAGDLDGFDVCRSLRTHSQVPILMLTARDGEDDRIRGFEVGADDYLIKPFSPRELVVRVQAILRRADPDRAASAASTVIAGGVEIDAVRREARAGGTPVQLAAREFDLLAHLGTHRGQVLSRQQLLDGVWGEGWVGDERTVDVHVRQLRKKLGDHLPLTTVWGVGYRLD